MSLANSKLLILLFCCSLLANAQPKLLNPFLQEHAELFTARLNLGENSWAGYMAIRYEDASNFRLSFTSAMGNTLMDLEWKGDQFEVHYLPEQLDRRMVIKNLKADFELMLLHITTKGKWKSGPVLKSGCRKYPFVISEQDLPLEVEERSVFGRKKRSVEFRYSEDKLLESLLLKHPTFAMKLELTTLAS